VLVGQAFRARDDSTFESDTGLSGHLSDYVGRIIISPGPYLEYVHRFRLDKDTLKLQRNEIELTGGPEWLKMSLGYVKLDDELSTDNLNDREELRLNANARLSKYWRLSAYDQIDLSDDGGTLFYGASLEYQDECLSFRVGFDRKFTRDRDVEPTTNIGFQIKLLHLG
jgi:LPS-assembly protein